VVLEGVTVSNGLDWSPDGSRAYYNDTSTHRVDVFDYDREAGLTGRRPFAEMAPARPDGLTVDSEGGVWVAISNGGEVRRYAPDGKLDEVVQVPVKKTTACTFGGTDLDQLFITTSQEGLEPGADPVAGSLFRVVPGVTGLPVREFAG
jgi:sugar lactone lactonase YvrE